MKKISQLNMTIDDIELDEIKPCLLKNNKPNDDEDNGCNKKNGTWNLYGLPRYFQNTLVSRITVILLILVLLALTGNILFVSREGVGIDIGTESELSVEGSGSSGLSHGESSSSLSHTSSNLETAHYDPNALRKEYDPFHLTDPLWYGGIFTEPPYLDFPHDDSDDDLSTVAPNNVGYIQYPDIYNNTIVFCSEGDVYLTTLSTIGLDGTIKAAMNSMRLTSTVGNVNTPKINHRYPYLVAFTATYTGHREAYLLDLRPNYRSRPSMRLTYTDLEHGLVSIVGWEDDGTTLVVSSHNREVALEDVRLYKIGIMQQQQQQQRDDRGRRTESTEQQNPYMASSVAVSSINPVPLSQAIDSVVDESSGCRFFTRYTQPSNTIRYTGGTAPNLWAYCQDEDLAVPLTQDYNGTSKSPEIYSLRSDDDDDDAKGSGGGEIRKFLFFLSDRVRDNSNDETRWIPSSMNLWVTFLPNKEELYNSTGEIPIITRPFQLTFVSCDFNGMPLQEYAIDDATGNVVLRIGANLHIMSRQDIKHQITAALAVVPRSGHRRMTDSFVIDEREKETDNDGSEGFNPPVIQRTTEERWKKPLCLPIVVYSDFNNLHERIRPLSDSDITTIDIYQTSYGTISTLMAAHGQLFVNPVIEDLAQLKYYDGGGMNMPPRRYRIAPGSFTGGVVRIFGAWHIPNPLAEEQGAVSRISLVLGTDPKSNTAEMAFYLLETSSEALVDFADARNLPTPILGGHVNGGSVADGGLGSVNVDSVSVSPCGHRVAWTDTDSRIVVMSLDSVDKLDLDALKIVVLPTENENGEPMINVMSLTFSPVGRYLAVGHAARNQFQVISIVDLGEPCLGNLTVERAVQATSDRFNSFNPFWGRLPVDWMLEEQKESTTLFFLTDRDLILSGASSPWGTRAPNPSFEQHTLVYALPLVMKDDDSDENLENADIRGNFVGGGASELMINHINSRSTPVAGLNMKEEDDISNVTDNSNATGTFTNKPDEIEQLCTTDVLISFDDRSDSMAFARRSFMMSRIPASNYIHIYQFKDNPSLLLVEQSPNGSVLIFVNIDQFPNDSSDIVPIDVSGLALESLGISTDRNFFYFTYSGQTKVVPNEASAFMSLFVSDVQGFQRNIVDTSKWAVNIWPRLEYQQMYSDAWRMLRDYYYDAAMGQIDWPVIHARYLPLVARCGKREELDDVLKQMSSELSALHVFVYGGEYNNPMHGNYLMETLNEVASLGAVLQRSVEWGGYVVKEIPLTDADFNQMDGKPIYSPLSARTLQKVGQQGLLEGDVIVRVNGENVTNVPDINMLLRGMEGRAVRLDVARVASKSSFSKRNQKFNMTDGGKIPLEPVIVVPITPVAAANLRYTAWEWKTRESAKGMAKNAGFTVGYMHLRSMSGMQGEDAFARGFYPDYDKEGLIIDVRHNVGGNIDSWLLNSLQRKAWMYFQGRATNITNGGLGWDEQFAFRGHIVVLVDEMTSSDGEGFSRGISELGLGLLVGTRTWGGGIWLNSDNRLVDRGIASAPEIGVYNAKFGWGLGIEQMGVEPDIVVDNNPKESFEGRDSQLERAILVLKGLLESDPIVLPETPGPHHDMSLRNSAKNCAVD